MLFQTVILSLVLLGIQASAQTQTCPTSFPFECTCADDIQDLQFTCITTPVDTWNIAVTFDAISQAINEDAVINKITIEAELLGQQQEIPAHSISALQTLDLAIFGAQKFIRIDPQAFSGSRDSAGALFVYEHNFAVPQEAFDLVNNFKQLQFFYFHQGTTLVEVPALALSADHPNLEWVYIDNTGLVSIGDSAFSGPPNLNHVSLWDNDLTLEGISNTAFSFEHTNVTVLLEMNPGLTQLAEEKFGNFLRQDNKIYVGAGAFGNNDPKYFLHCDERVDWICDAEIITRVNGYSCKETEFLDINAYCAQKFGLNSFGSAIVHFYHDNQGRPQYRPRSK